MREFDMEKLQHWNLIFKATCIHNNLLRSDLHLLLYLNPIKYFTRLDFETGGHYFSWDKKRFQRLKREKWVKIVFDARGTNEYNKYALSQKARLMINRMGKMIDGGDIPEIKNPSSYSQKVLNTSIKRYNKLKYGNERIYG